MFPKDFSPFVELDKRVSKREEKKKMMVTVWARSDKNFITFSPRIIRIWELKTLFESLLPPPSEDLLCGNIPFAMIFSTAHLRVEMYPNNF